MKYEIRKFFKKILKFIDFLDFFSLFGQIMIFI